MRKGTPAYPAGSAKSTLAVNGVTDVAARSPPHPIFDSAFSLPKSHLVNTKLPRVYLFLFNPIITSLIQANTISLFDYYIFLVACFASSCLLDLSQHFIHIDLFSVPPTTYAPSHHMSFRHTFLSFINMFSLLFACITPIHPSHLLSNLKISPLTPQAIRRSCLSFSPHYALYESGKLFVLAHHDSPSSEYNARHRAGSHRDV